MFKSNLKWASKILFLRQNFTIHFRSCALIRLARTQQRLINWHEQAQTHENLTNNKKNVTAPIKDDLLFTIYLLLLQ
jgi:hypothetical protein